MCVRIGDRLNNYDRIAIDEEQVGKGSSSTTPSLPGYGFRGAERASNSALSDVAIFKTSAKDIKNWSKSRPPKKKTGVPMLSQAAIWSRMPP